LKFTVWPFEWLTRDALLVTGPLLHIVMRCTHLCGQRESEGLLEWPRPWWKNLYAEVYVERFIWVCKMFP